MPRLARLLAVTSAAFFATAHGACHVFIQTTLGRNRLGVRFVVVEPESPAVPMSLRKRVVMIAHDNRKNDLLDWAAYNVGTLSRHELSATGTTGKLLADRLDLAVARYLSGPLGGDQQIGAAIAEGRVDLVIFFWDPLEPQPHDVDVKALLRIAVVYNTPIACNRSTADFLLSSPLMDEQYERFANAP
jgi:methylglyoxal synthase